MLQHGNYTHAWAGWQLLLYTQLTCGYISAQGTRGVFSASIISRCRHLLAVFRSYSNSTDSEEGPECKNFAWVITILELWPFAASGSRWPWQRYGSHAAPTYQVGKKGDSGPRLDKVLAVRDGLPGCCGIAMAENDAEKFSYRCVDYLIPSQTLSQLQIVVSLRWKCSLSPLEWWLKQTPSTLLVASNAISILWIIN